MRAGCTNFYEIPIETPIQPKMDVLGFQRVLVAGFISGGTDDVDANLETVRLLRSQLRTKSSLRVIEADALPLAEIAADKAKAHGDSGGRRLQPRRRSLPNRSTADVPTAARRRRQPGARRRQAAASRRDAKISNEKDLEKYQTRSSPTPRSGRSSARNTRTR